MDSSSMIPRMIHDFAENAVEKGKMLAEKVMDKMTGKFVDFGFNIGKNYIENESNMLLLEKKLEVLSSQESDIMQQLVPCEFSGKKKRKREVGIWLETVGRILRTEFPEIKGSGREKRLRNLLYGDPLGKLDGRVAELIEQRNNFCELSLDNHEYRGEGFLFNESLFGQTFNQQLTNIHQCLISNNIRRIGIHGTGGVGKTTLARHSYDGLLYKTDFKVCWLTVSPDLSIKYLQDKLAKDIQINLSDWDDEEARAITLSRKLRQMERFVLFLDGLQRGFHLEKLLGNLLDNQGCRLILMTNSSRLCHQMDCQRMFEVETLNAEEAWKLFKHILGQQTVLSTEVTRIAMAVAEMCAGLPSRIVTEARRMKGVEDIYEWRNTLVELEASSTGRDEMEGGTNGL